MIKLRNVEKYYNKNKGNEIHVLNNINIDLPNQGLVAIMGQSGSGKTTLLNALCGLDKIYSGEISVKNDTIVGYKKTKWDHLRNREFGYIFQNYNLFDDKTVFENVSFSLELLGFKDKNIIEEKVIEALTLVGMEKFRNRNANNLSGGQMQRVAIARAIVKDPQVVIADEPTGNLDEKNTLQIMNLLKKISKEKLVILVTHELEIGKFYADQVINIEDGQIKSIVENSANNKDTLNITQDNNIYLKDLTSEEETLNSVTLKTYHDGDKGDVTISVITVGNEIYIKAESDTKRIRYDGDTNVTIIDDSKPIFDQDQVDKEMKNFELVKIDKTQGSGRYDIGFWKYIKRGFQRLANTKKFKKICILGFFLSAFLLVVSASAYFKTIDIDESQFVSYDKSLYRINIATTISDDDVINLMDFVEDNFDIALLPISGLTFEVPGFDALGLWSARGYDINSTIKIDNSLDNDSVIISKLFAEKITNESLSFGNTIHRESQIYNLMLSGGTYFDVDIKVKDIVEDNGCIAYVNAYNYFKLLDKYFCLDNSLSDNEVKTNLDLGEENTITLYGKTYNATHVDGDVFLTANERVLTRYLSYDKVMSRKVFFYSDMEESELKELCDSNKLIVSLENCYKADYREAVGDARRESKVMFTIAILTLIVPLIFLFFLMRSSMISRVKETGVYRALGLSSNAIRKMYATESLAITIVGSLTGWAFGVFVILRTIYRIKVFDIFSANPIILFGCLGINVAINIIVGVLPITVLLRKTPAEILSKYDI